MNLPQGFKYESEQLRSIGVTDWSSLRGLSDNDINKLVQTGRSTVRNLKRLRGIATLVCELDICMADAALLMHSGIATVEAIARSSPQEIIKKTGRLERNLKSGTTQVVDITKANHWIRLARSRQIAN